MPSLATIGDNITNICHKLKIILLVKKKETKKHIPIGDNNFSALVDLNGRVSKVRGHDGSTSITWRGCKSYQFRWQYYSYYYICRCNGQMQVGLEASDINADAKKSAFIIHILDKHMLLWCIPIFSFTSTWTTIMRSPTFQSHHDKPTLYICKHTNLSHENCLLEILDFVIERLKMGNFQLIPTQGYKDHKLPSYFQLKIEICKLPWHTNCH